MTRRMNAETRALLIDGLLLEHASLEPVDVPLFTAAPISASELETLISVQLDKFAAGLE